MTRARIRVLGAGVAVLALMGLQLTVGAGAASAEPSAISFATASPVKTAFGGNWNVRLTTGFAAATTKPIPPDQATVDVYLSGITEPFAPHLPIQPDGSVYVSQAATRTLVPGDYQMTATLVPVPGSYIEGSTTTTPLVLTITAYAVDADISVDQGSVAAGEPVVEARLSGQFVDTTKAVPAGTWAFTVTSKGTTVLETEVAQEAGETDALRYAVPGPLDKGVDYTVSATFTPIDALAAGLQVTQPTDATFHTPGGSLADPIPYPLWLLIITCLVPLGLAAAAIVLTVRIGGRRAAVAGASDGLPHTDPAPVMGGPAQVAEPAWDPFAAPPEALPPTQVLRPAEPGEFTQLINPVPPRQPPVQQAPAPPPASWSLADETEDVDTQALPPVPPVDPHDPNHPR